MAGKPKGNGNAYRPLKALKRAPRVKKSYAQKALSNMKKRLSKPQRWQ